MTNINTMSDLHSPAPKTKWFKKPIVWLPVVAAVVAFAMGSGSTSARTVEVEKRVEVPVEKIRTVEKKVEVTPASCLEALTLSEQAFDYAAEALGYSGEALQAAARLNAPGIQAAKAKMDILNPKMSALAPKVNSAKAQCRAS